MRLPATISYFIIMGFAIKSSTVSNIRYSGNFLRTINFAVFVDFTATSKINPPESYYSIQMQ